MVACTSIGRVQPTTTTRRRITKRWMSNRQPPRHGRHRDNPTVSRQIGVYNRERVRRNKRTRNVLQMDGDRDGTIEKGRGQHDRSRRHTSHENGKNHKNSSGSCGDPDSLYAGAHNYRQVEEERSSSGQNKKQRNRLRTQKERRHRTLTADMTTAELACCRRGVTLSMIPSASRESTGVYLASESKINTWGVESSSIRQQGHWREVAAEQR